MSQKTPQQRIVLAGAPGTGKSTVINALREQGYFCLEEIARQITEKARQKGIDLLFLHDPIAFSKAVLEGRVAQFQEAALVGPSFYDRGIHEVLAYLQLQNPEIKDIFWEACQNHNYDKVFIFPPWKEIHVQDNIRYEDFEAVKSIHHQLLKTYQQFGMQPIEVPFGSVADRIEFILNKIS